MERKSGVKQGIKAAATTIFLMAALLSTGCGQTLMGPSTDTAQNTGVVASNAGTNVNPAGTNVNP